LRAAGRYHVSEEVSNDPSRDLQEEDGGQDPQKLQEQTTVRNRHRQRHATQTSHLTNCDVIGDRSYRLQQAGAVTQRPKTSEERD